MGKSGARDAAEGRKQSRSDELYASQRHPRLRARNSHEPDRVRLGEHRGFARFRSRSKKWNRIASLGARVVRERTLRLHGATEDQRRSRRVDRRRLELWSSRPGSRSADAARCRGRCRVAPRVPAAIFRFAQSARERGDLTASTKSGLSRRPRVREAAASAERSVIARKHASFDRRDEHRRFARVCATLFPPCAHADPRCG